MQLHRFHTEVLSAFFLVTLLSNAYPAPLSGVVLNQNGQPLQGAIVHYMKSNRKDTTDNLGRYSIDASATTSIDGAVPAISMEGNTPDARLFDLGGGLLAKSSGESLNRFLGHALRNLPTGTYLLQAGNRVLKVRNHSGFNYALPISVSREMGSILSKASAGAAAGDTLFFAAFGKSPQKVALQANQTNVPNVTLSGTQTTFNGYTEHDFVVAGRAAKIVEPKTALPSKPWIWRARFWNHWPEVDKALLAMGYHLVYLDIIEYYGNPASVGWWNEYYDLLTGYYGFNKKAVLEGMSRGGLSIFNWAIQKPGAVQAMYADAPVMDIRSWPGFAELQRTYGFKTEAEWRAYTGHAIDHLKPLADANVPVFLVIGDADSLYPMEVEFEKRYRALNGIIQVIVKTGVGHVHGLPSPKPIVDFVHSYLK